MTFIDERFPAKVRLGHGDGPQFRTEVATLAAGDEQRRRVWRYARHTYRVKGVYSDADAQSIRALFYVCAGRANPFRFRDPDDYVLVDEPIGVSTAIVETLEITKTYAIGAHGYERLITKPVELTVVVKINGAVQLTGWSLEETNGVVTGRILFDGTQPAGAVTVSGEFDVAVRFDTDENPRMMNDRDADGFLSFFDEIPLIEVRE